MSKARDERRPLDWQQVRERLARATAAEDTRLSPERAQTILEERARALACVPAEAARAAEVVEVVAFRVAGERYAVSARHVREVVRMTECTPVPGAPDLLAGVVNLRGEILAVFEPRVLLGLGGDEETPSRILVLGDDRAEFGLLADAVHEVLVLRRDDILPPPDALAGPGWGHLRGVTAGGLVVLDGAALLQDRRLYIDLGEAPAPEAGGEKP